MTTTTTTIGPVMLMFLMIQSLDLVAGAPPVRLSHCSAEPNRLSPVNSTGNAKKTEQIFKDCVGRPSEVVQSNKEYTEDVTEQVVKRSFPLDPSPENGPFDFPGLRSNMEAAIKRSFIGGIGCFFEAAEERKRFFDVFGDRHYYDWDSSSSAGSRKNDG